VIGGPENVAGCTWMPSWWFNRHGEQVIGSSTQVSFFAFNVKKEKIISRRKK
jgi:hypothetical protein